MSDSYLSSLNNSILALYLDGGVLQMYLCSLGNGVNASYGSKLSLA